MMFSKLFVYDIKAGFRRKQKAYMAFAGIVFVLMSGFLRSIWTVENERVLQGLDPVSNPTIADWLAYLYKGVDPQMQFGGVNIPIAWLLMEAGLFYLTMLYLKNDMNGYELHVWLRCRKKQTWWISKCLEAVLTVVLCHAIVLLAVLAFCFLTKGEMSFRISNDWWPAFSGEGYLWNGADTFFYLVLKPFIIDAGLCLIQQSVLMIWNGYIAYLVVLGYLLMSVYFVHPLFVGNLLMLKRLPVVSQSSVSPGTAVTALIIIAVALTVAGCFYVKKLDLIRKEADEKA